MKTDPTKQTIIALVAQAQQQYDSLVADPQRAKLLPFQDTLIELVNRLHDIKSDPYCEALFMETIPKLKVFTIANRKFRDQLLS